MNQTLTDRRQEWLGLAGNILGRALVLAAISELAFVNELPVISLLRSESLFGGVTAIAFLVGFYLVPAALLYALEGSATGWATVLLVGALVGWSIEGALVPAVYEAPPFSFIWTSAAWHAPIEVGVALYLIPHFLARNSLNLKGVAAAIGIGVVWAVWAIWTWPDLTLSLSEFATLVGVVTSAIWVGYALVFGRNAGQRCSMNASRVFIVVNLVLAVLWAVSFPVFAAMLAALVALNIFALMRGARARPPLARRTLPRKTSAAYLAITGASAVAAYWCELTFGAPIPTEDVVLLVFLPGSLAWVAALVAATLSRPGKKQVSGV